ncbi:MAG: efflux RND transporter permease subunit, partial [Candidatus Izimaplasma sp.]|nr:efflux RND transporter permease subunit [Candidatus Izimaplasma bacterium]
MKKIIDIIFSRRKLVILLFTLILGYGIYSYLVIPKQEMPTFDSTSMVITIVAPGVNARDIEDEIVSDIEKLILTYDDVSSVRSVIYDNYCVIQVMFLYSTENTGLLSSEIFDKINELSLNDNISDISYTSEFEDPHIIFAVHSNTISDEQLLTYSEKFKNDLLLIDEIKKVEIDSVFNNEVIITLDTSLLDLYGLSLSDIYSILYANSINIPLGGLSTVYGTISISSDSSFDDISTLENMIIIPEIPGVSPQVLLSDLGTVELVNTSTKIYEFNQDKAIFLSVYFQHNIDFTKMGDEVLNTKDAYLIEESNNNLNISEMLFLP